MKETARLAGLVAAHAILCVSKEKSLTIPLLVNEKENGQAQFIQITGKSSEEAVAKAGAMMRKPAAGTQRAVMAFEAYLNLPPERTDAIFIEGRTYGPESKQLLLAVPFRLAKHPKGFAVFRPKFFEFENDAPYLGILEEFLQGIALHPPGQKVWQDHLDESR